MFRSWGIAVIVGGLVAAAAWGLVSGNVQTEAGETGNSAGTATQDPTPVVVELFTSEGCSSCPPADRLLIRLLQSQPVPGAKIIALGQHVDYWNRLGWYDPFSSPYYSLRQQSYAGVFGLDGVYTPQMVVDGQKTFVGSDEARAVGEISTLARTPKARVHISRSESAGQKDPKKLTLHVRVEGLDRSLSRERAEVWLAITEDALESSVMRGENSGRRLQHFAVVRTMKVIGKVKPGKATEFTAQPTVSLHRDWKRGNLNAVVFVQEQRARKILGAGSLGL